MNKRRSAYQIPFARATLTEAEKRKAIEWWQSGGEYHPLTCPICAGVLSLASRGVMLECPTDWCSYKTLEIPWGIFAAWQKKLSPPV